MKLKYKSYYQNAIQITNPLQDNKMAITNVNRRCKKTFKVPKLKSRGTMKKHIFKRASVKKTAVSSKCMNKRTGGRTIKKVRGTMRRRTATKSRSVTRKAVSKMNKIQKSRKSLCVKRISMKRQQKKRVSSNKRNVIRRHLTFRKSSKSRSRSSIRCVQKKRVSSKIRSVIRKQAKIRKSSKSCKRSKSNRQNKKRVASKRRLVIRKYSKVRKSTKSRSRSTIRRLQNKRVAPKRRSVNRKQYRRAPKIVTNSRKHNNNNGIKRAISKRRSTVVKRKNGKPGSKCDKKLRLAIEEFLNCTKITEKELSCKELQKALFKLKKRNLTTKNRKSKIMNRSKSRKSVKKHTKRSRSHKVKKGVE